jgi:hypothetical protein
VALLHTDPLTGLKRSRIRFPDGHPPTPFGCRWCGQTQRAHGYGPTHLPGHGFHAYTQPKDQQILARMRARRAARGCRCHIPTVNPWRCEADTCAMLDDLLRGWTTPAEPGVDLPELEVLRPDPPYVAHHATSVWSGSSIPDDEGDELCADCRTPDCARFLRIQRRHARANSTRIGGGLWGGFAIQPPNLPAGR